MSYLEELQKKYPRATITSLEPGIGGHVKVLCQDEGAANKLAAALVKDFDLFSEDKFKDTGKKVAKAVKQHRNGQFYITLSKEDYNAKLLPRLSLSLAPSPTTAPSFQRVKPQTQNQARGTSSNANRQLDSTQLFQEFVKQYLAEYNKVLIFKNPWSAMKRKLATGKITNWEQVLDHVNKNKNSRSAKIVANNVQFKNSFEQYNRDIASSPTNSSTQSVMIRKSDGRNEIIGGQARQLPNGLSKGPAKITLVKLPNGEGGYVVTFNKPTDAEKTAKAWVAQGVANSGGGEQKNFKISQ